MFRRCIQSLVVLATILAACPGHATVLTTVLVNPDGVLAGKSIRITWDDDLVASSKQVFLWDGDRGTMMPISDVLPSNSHEFVWNVTPDILPGNRYRFVVRDPLRNHIAEFSNGFMSLQGAAPLATALHEQELGSDIHCKPMPANEQVEIAWQLGREVALVELLSVHNEVLETVRVSPQATQVVISAKNVPSGLALVRITSLGRPLVVQPMLVVH